MDLCDEKREVQVGGYTADIVARGGINRDPGDTVAVGTKGASMGGGVHGGTSICQWR